MCSTANLYLLALMVPTLEGGEGLTAGIHLMEKVKDNLDQPGLCFSRHVFHSGFVCIMSLSEWPIRVKMA